MLDIRMQKFYSVFLVDKITLFYLYLSSFVIRIKKKMQKKKCKKKKLVDL